MLAGSACDGEAAVEQDEPALAAQNEYTASQDGSVDLDAVFRGIDDGSIADAEDLEAKLNDPEQGLSTVDVDGDGKLDTLVMNEQRDEATATSTFEIRALPTATKVDVEAAPVVAKLQFVADVDAQVVTAEAELQTKSPKKKAVHREWRESAHVENDELVVSVQSNVFVNWVFAVERPVYVASVHVQIDVHPSPDPCWPPGHCKHGHWKARHSSSAGHVRVNTGKGGKIKVHSKFKHGKKSGKHGGKSHGGKSHRGKSGKHGGKSGKKK